MKTILLGCIVYSMKKKIIIIVSILVGCFLLGLGIGTAISKISSKTLDVAFYKLDKEITNPVEKVIKDSYQGKVKFYYLNEKDFNSKKISKKYDLFFSWNGECVESLKEYAKTIPEDVKPLLISKVKTTNYLPILMDHYELSYYKPARIKAGLNIPQDFNELQAYFFNIKSQVFVPFVLEGSADEDLISYIGAQLEALCGTNDYYKLIDLIKENPDLSQIIDTKCGFCEVINTDITLRFLLDGLRNYSAKEMTYPNWFRTTQKDIKTFAEDNQIGVLFTSLSKHRKMDLKIIKDFETERMPVMYYNEDHSLVAPELCLVKLSKYDLFDEVIKNFVTDSNQSYLSDETKLAPVNARTMAFDSQADDVRYLAAVAPKGPVPDLANACFQTNSELLHNFVEQIRTYIESGTIL